ncbi:MAG: hypothetical protein V1740_00440 [Candidatus Woesearchaeota archaeon]
MGANFLNIENILYWIELLDAMDRQKECVKFKNDNKVYRLIAGYDYSDAVELVIHTGISSNTFGFSGHTFRRDHRYPFRSASINESGVVTQIESKKGLFRLDTTSGLTQVVTDMPSNERILLIKNVYDTMAAISAGWRKAKIERINLDPYIPRSAMMPGVNDLLYQANRFGFSNYIYREESEGWSKFKPPTSHPTWFIYNPVVEGCAKAVTNPCVFCTLYDGVGFRVVPLKEFKQNEQRLKKYAEHFIRGHFTWHKYRSLEEFLNNNPIEESHHIIRGYYSMFWGDGNILFLDHSDLIKRLNIHRKTFTVDGLPVEPNPKAKNPITVSANTMYDYTAETDISATLSPVTAFAHLSSVLRHANHLKKYLQRGLTDLWVGVESGDPVTLKQMNKSISPAMQKEALSALQESGIAIRATVFSTAIDEQRAEEHIQRTVDAVSGLTQGANCVYLSDIVVHPGTELHEMVQAGDVRIPSGQRVKTLKQILKDELSRRSVMTWDYPMVT